ncbi:MAG: hypothetical protein SGJ24_02265 [Chloroflexota bacterium]|nr:hypothetical protein [Chloroflexota bacterium]
MTRIIRVVLLLALFGLVGAAGAQDETPIVESPFGVYVTTQDFVSFRVGPGTAFERTAVVPAVATLPAVGRTPNGNWIQVEYLEARGWIAARHLVWSGNLAALPVSTMEETVRVVRTGAIGEVNAGTRLFDNQFREVMRAPADAGVELIGRLGSGVYIWIQVDYRGTPYWVRSWEIAYDREYLYTLDVAYLIPYTRLARGLNSDIARAGSRLLAIEDIWYRLQNGGSVVCNALPSAARRETQDSALRSEPIFLPVISALDESIIGINTAVSALTEVCSRPPDALFLTQAEVIAALTTLADARLTLVLADSLASALFARDPIVAASRGG